MAHGGKRKGAGRPKGSKNKPRLQLQVEGGSATSGKSPAQRMREIRQRVALLVSDGMPVAKISAVMGYPEQKLRALFDHELAHGKEIVRAQMLASLAEAGESGNVAAAKALLANADPEGTQNPDGPEKTAREGLHQAALKILEGGKAKNG